MISLEYQSDFDRETDYDGDQSSIRSDSAFSRFDSAQFPQRPPSSGSQAARTVPTPSKSSTYKPISVLNQSSTNGGAGSLPSSPKARTGFRLFGKKKKSQTKDIDSDMIGRATSPSPTIEDDDTKTMDFESLMMSGGTMKVTLTPNRLKSIEVEKIREQQEELQNTWRRKKPDIEIIPPPKSDLLKRVALQNMAQNVIREEGSGSPSAAPNGRPTLPKDGRPPPIPPPRKQKRWPDSSSTPPIPSNMRNNVIIAHQNGHGQISSNGNSPASPTFSTRSVRTMNSIASLPSESDGDESNRRDSLLSQSSTLSSLIKSAPAPPANSTMPKVPEETLRNGPQRPPIPSTPKPEPIVRIEPQRPSSPSHIVSTNENKPKVPKVVPKVPLEPIRIGTQRPPIPSNTKPEPVIRTAQERPSSPSHNFTTNEFKSVQPSIVIAPRSPKLTKSSRKKMSMIIKAAGGDDETDSVTSEPVDSDDDEDVGKEQPSSAFKAITHRTIVSSMSMDQISSKTNVRPSAVAAKRIASQNQMAPKSDHVQLSTSDLILLHSKMTTATSVEAATNLLQMFLTVQGVSFPSIPKPEAPFPAEQAENTQKKEQTSTPDSPSPPITNDNAVQTDPWEPVCEHQHILPRKKEEPVESPLISDPGDYIQVRIAPIVTVTDCDELNAIERQLDLSELDGDSSDDYSDVEDVIPMSRFAYPPAYQKADFRRAKSQVFESDDEEWFLEDSDNEFEPDHIPPPHTTELDPLEVQMVAEWLLG
jgi:hypothetical protein